MPKEIGSSHFGPGLKQFIAEQHYACRVPQGRILDGLIDKGVVISEGQIDIILKNVAKDLKTEKEALLLEGLKSSYVQTDDTGSRHKKKNGFATVICSDFFAYFRSSDSKSRINFLKILCGEKIEYTITPESIDYAKIFEVKAPTLNLLNRNLNATFDDCEKWDDFLTKNLLGKKSRRILTEGALIGTLMVRKTLTLDMILMSDGAGQFNLFTHVLCWIHIERSIKRLIPLNEQDREAINKILDDLWIFYRDLKAFKLLGAEAQKLLKLELAERFDTILATRPTMEPHLAVALKKIRDCKAQLLLVLDHPYIPLHNNASESDIREYVIRRKISGGTRSDDGRDARDTFASIYKTCRKLGISFWKFLGDRIRKIYTIPLLAEQVKNKITKSLLTPPAT